MKTMDDSPPLLSLTEVGKRLRKDRGTVRRWIDRGYLEGKRLGGRTYVTTAELDRFLREGQR